MLPNQGRWRRILLELDELAVLKFLMKESKSKPLELIIWEKICARIMFFDMSISIDLMLCY